MSNLLPLPKALEQARAAALDYAAALDVMRSAPKPKTRLPDVAQAYQKLSAAQWELEQVLGRPR